MNALRARVRAFVDEQILPVEETIFAEDRQGHRQTLQDLQEKARQAGLWTPHLPPEWGGLGLGVMGMATLFRDMGRSLVGPKVFHCDAPDQGNMDLLLHQADPSQRERYLRPLVEGKITSAFCMTEPAPGAGADPSNLRTSARPDGADWIIDGLKWYSTGGATAAFLVVMARTGESEATLFLVDRQAEGVEHVRNIAVMGDEFLDHHEAELRFTGVRVAGEAVLGEVGQGFRLAQARLVPARLTHCMRWLGLADRALSMCREYLERRQSFGKPLARHQAMQQLVADNAIAIHSGNLMTMHCAGLFEQDNDPRLVRAYSSMAKKQVAQTLCKVLDDAIQMHGGLGYSDDMPFARWYRWARAARIADGPDEVHQMVIAREFLAGRLELLT
ncbi:MAG: acyl-CoA dehydrogenase family protein [Vulcanimicrobiota bacterium]